MALSAQQLQQIFSGGMTPSTPNMNSIYGGVLPSLGGGNPALNAINAAAPTNSSRPASWMAYEGGVPVGSSVGGAGMPQMPQPRPGGAPTSIDMAAINGQPQGHPAINSVTGQMKQGGSPGGLLSLLLGSSKNGLPGLAGLLGGPQQGGLLQMLLGGNRGGARAPTAAYPARPSPLTGTARVAASLGLNPGSVAATEAWHGGGSSNPQSGGPAVGGSYGGS